MALLFELTVLLAGAGALYALHRSLQPRWAGRALAFLRSPPIDDRAAVAARDSWRAYLFLAVFGAAVFLSVGLIFEVFRTRGLVTSLSELAELSRRWDVTWYEAIAKNGYFNEHTYAFWPLFPLLAGELMKLLSVPFHTAGIILSIACLILTAWGLSLYLARRPAREGVATALLFVLFPTSFVLLIGYSESLYLALSFFCLWFFHRGRPLLGGILGMAASASRYSGVFLFVALLAAEMHERGWAVQRRTVVGLILIPLGAVSFMFYCAARTGSPFEMVTAQALWDVHVLPSNVLRSIFHHELYMAIRTNPFRWWPEWWRTSPGWFEFLIKFNLQATLNRGLPLLVVPLSALMIYQASEMPLAWRFYGFILAFFPLLMIPDDYLRFLQVDFPLFLFAAKLLAKRTLLLGALVAGSAMYLTFIAWGFVTGFFA